MCCALLFTYLHEEKITIETYNQPSVCVCECVFTARMWWQTFMECFMQIALPFSRTYLRAIPGHFVPHLPIYIYILFGFCLIHYVVECSKKYPIVSERAVSTRARQSKCVKQSVYKLMDSIRFYFLANHWMVVENVNCDGSIFFTLFFCCIFFLKSDTLYFWCWFLPKHCLASRLYLTHSYLLNS